MARILIYARTNTNPDPEVDWQWCYKKGYPVVVLDEDQWNGWGNAEGLPIFIQLHLPNVTRAQVQHFFDSWQTGLVFTVDSANAATATYTVTVHNRNTSVSGAAGLTLATIQVWLDKWGCAFVSATASTITLTAKLWDMVRSAGFWGLPTSSIGFTLSSYNATTGVARILANYSDTSIAPENVKHLVEEKGGVVVSNELEIVTFDINRQDVYGHFKDAVKQALDQVYCRKQYYFPETWVDQMVASGGVAEMTGAEAIALIKNKLDE